MAGSLWEWSGTSEDSIFDIFSVSTIIYDELMYSSTSYKELKGCEISNVNVPYGYRIPYTELATKKNREIKYIYQPSS